MNPLANFAESIIYAANKLRAAPADAWTHDDYATLMRIDADVHALLERIEGWAAAEDGGVTDSPGNTL